MKILLLTAAFAAVSVLAKPSAPTSFSRLHRRASPEPGFCGPWEGKSVSCALNSAPCCSKFNFCGDGPDYCGEGCKPEFGKCTGGGPPALPEPGFCGVWQGKTLSCGMDTEPCCSQFNFCGATPEHCGAGCKPEFGLKCNAALPPRTVPLKPNAEKAEIHNTCTSPGMLAVTLDDGHHLTLNKKFLDMLAKNKILATFYINGINGNWDITKNLDYVKRAYDAGHQIAHHTYSHLDAALLDDGQFVSELCNLDMAIAEALGGIIPRYLRFPFLSYTPQKLKIAEYYEYIVVGVNIDTKDYDDKAQPSRLEYALKAYSDAREKSTVKKDSFISLQHEIQEFTANELFPKLLPQLKTNFLDKDGKAYRTVTTGECLGKSNPKDWYRANMWHRNDKNDKFYCPPI